MKKILLSILVSSVFSPSFASESQKKEFDLLSAQYAQTKKYNIPAVKKLACNGYVEAQTTMAKIGVQENNLFKYSFWLLEAAQRGDKSSQRSIATNYDRGLGLGKNDKEGYKWFYLFSKGQSSSQWDKNHWGKKLSSKEMEEVELSANKFKPLEEKEVKNCDVAFQFFTDTQQRLVEIDKKKATTIKDGANERNVKIVESLKDKNDIDSQVKKVVAYYESARINKLNLEEKNKFLALLKDLTDKKNPQALMVLARMNMEGLAAPKNIPQAIAIYESLAQINFKPAIFALEYMNNRKLLPEQNKANLIKRYENSTDSSDKLRLASMYIIGMGVPKDTAKGMAIYDTLIKAGNKDAKKAVGNLYLSNALSKREPAKAIVMLEDVAKSGDEITQNFLAAYYMKNNDNQTNHPRALFWYKKLAEESSTFAAYNNLAQLYVKHPALKDEASSVAYGMIKR